jgi:hypothetical protein
MASYAYTFASGDTVTPTKLNNARTVSEIVNADVSATAAIAGTKVAPAFGAQNVTTTAAVGVGTTSLNVSGYGTTNLTVRGGTTIQGVVELVGTRADGANNAAGDMNFFADSNSSGNKLISSIQAITSGTTSNNRGGTLTFFTKSDGGAVAERMRINASGNVGIGTTSPAARLTIVTPAAEATALIISDATNYTLRAGFTASGVGYIGADTGSALALYSNNTERMRIDASGNVGIGTASPNAAARLDVSSTTQGFLPPRMTTAQRDAITSPPAGLMIYNTSTNKLNVRTASSWEAVTSA